MTDQDTRDQLADLGIRFGGGDTTTDRISTGLREAVEAIRDDLAARGKPQNPEWAVRVLAAIDRTSTPPAPDAARLAEAMTGLVFMDAASNLRIAVQIIDRLRASEDQR